MAIGEKIPHGFGIIENTGIDFVVDKILKICQEAEISAVIIGLPEEKNQDSEHLIKEIKNIGSQIKEKSKMTVIYEPEQYSSVEAERILKEHGQYDRSKKEKVDEMAAVLLLEQYLNQPI